MKDDFLDNLKEELSDVKQKINKLKVFIHSSFFTGISKKQQVLLKLQLNTLKNYEIILQLRLNELSTKS